MQLGRTIQFGMEHILTEDIRKLQVHFICANTGLGT